jgi:hypothetical protein
MRSPVGIQARKELRELLPWWGAAAITVFAAGQISQQGLIWPISSDVALSAGLAAYIGGAVSLGSLAVGQEYSNRTLPALLAQPVSRTRVLGTKLIVLGGLLAALAAVAVWQLRADAGFWHGFWHEPAAVRVFIVLPPLAALLLTPWLTLAARGPLAGAVFSVALPMLMFVVSVQTHPSGFEALNFAFVGTLTLAAIGGLLTWRAFLLLEATDGAQGGANTPAWMTRGAGTSRLLRLPGRSPVVHLVAKELNVQQMALVVSSLYLAMAVVLIALRDLAEVNPSGTTLESVTWIHSAFVLVLVGALTTAEERQYRTIESQVLQPMRARTQWAIKVGTSLFLALALAIGLPVLVVWLAGGSDRVSGLRFHEGLWGPMALLWAAGIWASSFTTGGVCALMATGVAIAAAGLAMISIFEPLGRALARALPRAVTQTPIHLEWATFMTAAEISRNVLVGGLAILLVAMAARNYRRADTGRSTVLRQIAWLAGCGVLLTALHAAFIAVWMAFAAQR